MVTIKSVDVGEVKCSVTIINKNLCDTKDKFIGNNKCLLEKSREEYFKEDFKL